MSDNHQPAQQRRQGSIAGIGIRILASLYDGIILLGIAILLVGLPITLSIEVLGATPPKWLQYLLFMSVAYAYFVGFWVKGGATTGMRPWKLMVAMNGTGDPLTWTVASVRFAIMMTTWLTLAMTLWYIRSNDTGHFLFFIAATIPAVSLIVMLLSKERAALQDIISGSGMFRVSS
ncbi:MAG: RDD family protein [Mariprofundus sp.]|nr:RDD family protein [Mariprofundus sp.]